MKSITLFTTTALVAATLPTGGAFAQEAGSDASVASAEASSQASDGGIEEIVVTAQKRSENAQRVPIAISAFTANALKERSIGNVSQIANIAPNTTLDAGTPYGGSSALLAAYIRGVGSNDFAFNIDPGVGVYVDGVYLARTIGANQDLLDVSRIEILKGPQGTLFGRNTIGGAVSIVTRDPGDEFAVNGDVTVGSYRLRQVRGSVDIPLSDALRSSISFSAKDRLGYQRRLPFPGQPTTHERFVAPSVANIGGDRQGGEDGFSGRMKLKWDDGGRFRVTLSGDYSTSRDEASPNTLIATGENVPGPFAGTNNIPGTALDPSGQTGFGFAGLYNFCIGSTSAQIAARGATNLCGPRGTPLTPALQLPSLASVNVDTDPTNDRLPYDSRFITGDPDTTYADGNDFSHLKVYGVAAVADLDVGASSKVKSITAYRGLRWRTGSDMDGSPLNTYAFSFDIRQWQFSQELQLTGAALSDKIKYIVGGYYFEEGGNNRELASFADELLPFDGQNKFGTKNYAAFGQVDFRMSDLIGITVGARYTREKKSYEGFQTELNGFYYKLFNCPIYGDPCTTAVGYDNVDQPLRVYPTGVNYKTFNNFSPKLGVQLYPTDRTMAYASWSRGYKTGGWTARVSAPVTGDAPGFGPEQAETWEVGVKSQLLDRKLQLNLAAFTTKYRDIQLNFIQGVSPTLQNAGTARIKGFEAEATFAPVDRLTINASVGYLDARYTSILPQSLVAPNAFQAGVFAGADLPKTPKWKLSVGPRYQLNLGNGGSIVVVADWTHSTSLWNDTERTLLLRRPATDIFNSSVTYRSPDGRYDLSVGGTNLTDERYLITGSFSQGTVFGTYSRPAEWFGRLSFHL